MAITGKQLLESLQEFSEEDLEKDVHFAYNYGDHWHTVVAPGAGYITDGIVVRSDYHQMDKVFDEDEDGMTKVRPDNARDVLIIWS